jgi:outer membrane receptor protein involved in Fe transport
MHRQSALAGCRCAVLSAALTLGDPAPVFADAIEDLIVTARKREESLQDVPISITAFSGEQMRARGIANNYDLAQFTPNFNTVKQVGRRLDRPVIRGMAAPSTRGEPNASYFIDGIFVSSSVSTATVEAVERTEILRGPQSAQFGRATFAGAVNYVTRKPTDEFESQITAKAGTHDDYRLGAWISGPLIRDRLLYLVSANWEKYGGEWHNALEEDSAYPGSPFIVDPPQQGDSSRLGSEETKDVLTKLTWLAADGTEINLKYSYTEGDDSHWPSLITTELNCWLPPDDLPAQPQPGEPAWWRTTSGAFCGEFDATGRENRVNLPDFRNGVQALTPPGEERADFFAEPVKPGTRRETHRVLAAWIQDLGGWELAVKGSYSDEEFGQAFDLDHQQVRALFGLFSFYQETTTEDYSGELRISSPADRKIRGQLGGYIYDREFRTRQRSFPGIATVTAGVPPTFADWELRDTENVAVFGSLEWDLTDRLTVALEGRWAEDTKGVTPANNDCPGVEETFDNFTPRISLRWRATDDLNLYLLAAKGNKPGDFNTEYFRPEVASETQAEALRNGDAVIAEEEQWTYELGLKSTWFDYRVTANFAVFYIDWTNQGTFNTVMIPLETGGELATTVVRNAGKSEVTGLELETSWVVTDHLTVLATYGFINGEFVTGQDEFLFNSTGDGNLKGKEIPSTPEHQVVLGAVARQQVNAELDGFLRMDFIYESERWSQAANFGQIPDRELVNLRLGLEAEQWTLNGYVTNLLDDNSALATLNFVNFDDGSTGTAGATLSNGNMANMWSLNPQRGRNWGVEFQYRFRAW